MLAAITAPAGETSDAPASVSETATEAFFNDDGVEIAGPGPETMDSFRAKVQKALETLDPKVAGWWRANSIQGLVRSREAWFWQFDHYSYMDGDRPIVVVDNDLTAGQTAQAIISEVTNGWFADSIGAYYKRYDQFSRTLDFKEFQAWQQRAAGEAAQLASALAELYVGSIATLSPTGDIVFTLGDLAENGSRWSQLVSVLPLLGHLPVAAIVLKVGKRKVRIRKRFARLLEHLTEAERKSILTEVGTATSDKEAAEIVRRRVARLVDERQIHHAISDEVYNALEEHKRLKGKYRLRDKRFETLAKDFESHHGYQGWHRDLDLQVAEWIKRHRSADEATFEKWLRWRYREPDLSKRFPSGLK